MSIIEKSQEAIRKILGDKNKPEQYANYLKTIDRLAKVRARLPGRISMSRILQSYQDRALRIAQAKYYQRQAKT